MNFLGIGTGELLLILVIVLLVMGPERLPQLARQWAKIVKTLSQFTRTWQQFNAELNRQLTLEEMAGKQSRPPARPAPEPESNNTIAPPELARQAAPDASGQPDQPAAIVPTSSDDVAPPARPSGAAQTAVATTTGSETDQRQALSDQPAAPAEELRHEQ